MIKPKPLEKRPGMTGVAFSFEASVDHGFSNFRIVTLFVVDGEIVYAERTQPYANFEGQVKAELMLASGLWNLASRYKDGLMMGLGGENRDALVERLKKSNPAILKRISPALGLL